MNTSADLGEVGRFPGRYLFLKAFEGVDSFGDAIFLLAGV